MPNGIIGDPASESDKMLELRCWRLGSRQQWQRHLTILGWFLNLVFRCVECAKPAALERWCSKVADIYGYYQTDTCATSAQITVLGLCAV